MQWFGTVWLWFYLVGKTHSDSVGDLEISSHPHSYGFWGGLDFFPDFCCPLVGSKAERREREWGVRGVDNVLDRVNNASFLVLALMW